MRERTVKNVRRILNQFARATGADQRRLHQEFKRMPLAKQTAALAGMMKTLYDLGQEPGESSNG